MMINGLWNKRIGPGGGTRRLHQKKYGGETGSTSVVKMGPFIRHSTTVSGLNLIDVANNRRRFDAVANQAVATLVTGSVKMFNPIRFTGTPVAANSFEVVAAAAA